jgi:hypothetical protein
MKAGGYRAEQVSFTQAKREYLKLQWEEFPKFVWSLDTYHMSTYHMHRFHLSTHLHDLNLRPQILVRLPINKERISFHIHDYLLNFK